MNNYITLTDHSVYRGYDRLFKNSDELLEIANLAYIKGLDRKDIRGKFRQYIDRKSKNHIGSYYRIYEECIWIYSPELGVNTSDRIPLRKLITFYKVPPRFKNMDIYLVTHLTHLNKEIEKV